MNEDKQKLTAVTVWRLGIRDRKDWNRWSWSPSFDTIDKCFNQYKDWLAAHPGAVIKFITQKEYR